MEDDNLGNALPIGKHEEMVEMIEDRLLLEIVEKRLKESAGERTYSLEEVLEMLGITEEDLENIEVEID
ncbi:hypothetical protein [Methanolapillus africanus]|uniref:hypothetical protein n=1 Tax=Methanolapillus africanus TaxID=3028297 RepID=UPI0030B87159